MNKKELFEEANFLDNELRKITCVIKETSYRSQNVDIQTELWELRDKIKYAIKRNDEELKKILQGV